MSEHEQPTEAGRIGGHGFAAILGQHPHLGLLDVYLSALRLREVQSTPEMEAGHLFEPALLEHARRVLGYEFLDVPGPLDSALYVWLRASPDAITPSPRRELISAKFVGLHRSRYWGAANSDDVPAYVTLQETAYLGILGMERSHVVACIAGRPPQMFEVPFSETLWSIGLEASERFYRRHILPRVPPAPDGSERYEKWIRAELKQTRPELRPATGDEDDLVRDLRDLLVKERAHARRVQEARQRLMKVIDADAGIESVHGAISWKTNKAGARVLRTPNAWRDDDGDEEEGEETT